MCQTAENGIFFSMKTIGTIHSPFFDLVGMPMQPKDTRDTIATIEIDRRLTLQAV